VPDYNVNIEPGGAMNRLTTAFAVALIAALSGHAVAQSTRDYLIIVGSTTVFPFAEEVIDRYTSSTGRPKPQVQPTGTGGGIALFCNGTHILDPDITFASRPIREKEIAACQKNGVDPIVEVKIGYDGVVLAGSGHDPAMSLTRRDLYLALAKEIPDGKGDFIANPNKTWRDVNENLPGTAIEVWGPKKGSGTRYVLQRAAMEEGCRTLEGMIDLEDEEPWRYYEVCRTIREDQAYVLVGEDDNLNVKGIIAKPGALLITSYGVFEPNMGNLNGATIDGIEPNFQTIANGSYLMARPLYMYVKTASAGKIPGLEEFIIDFIGDDAWGPAGYMRPYGLIPLGEEEREKYAEIAISLTPMKIL
jgi:phosphate transport system substrate-binding protein